MDQIRNKVISFVSKYRYVLLVLMVGVVLMLLPTGKKTEQKETSTEPITTVSMEQQLEQILSHVQGVGKVKVLLTIRNQETYIYRTDEDGTVIITDSDRNQSGLTETILSPEYRGAVVVCQGADSASVQLQIIEAVANVTGLRSDQITVLKMK